MDLQVKQKKVTNPSEAEQKTELRAPINKPFVLIDSSGNSRDWLKKFLEGVSTLDVNLGVAGDLGVESSDCIAVFKDKMEIEAAYKMADFVVFPEYTVAKLMQAWSNGVVPICQKSVNVKDYDPIKETGNAFVAESDNEWAFFAALVRGLETYKFPYDWKHVILECRQSL